MEPAMQDEQPHPDADAPAEANRSDQDRDRPDRRKVERKVLWKRLASAAGVVVGALAVALKVTRRR
jgi:hypothetical protein